MEREQEFDAFYRATRHGLVHLAFALTGNLSAAQKAVRAAYVAAWHHWRKVSALPDPADWVRPRALRMAQRRRTPRLRRGQRGVAGRDRAVLEAAGRLRPPQRQVLVLTEVAGLSLPAAARELGIPEETAERLLHSARATFSVSLDRDPANIHAHLQSLGETAGHASLPRPSSIRSAGRQRRQSYALLVAAAAAAVAVASGAVAYEPATVRAGQAPAEVHRVSPPAPSTGDSPAGTGRPTTAAQLLDQDQIERLGPHQRWTVERTDDNTTGDGINTFCQQSRFADPDGRAAFVRIFKADGKPRRSAVQTVEVSRSAAQARRTYDTTLGWYSGCRLARL
ncbi:MAG TPA: sigma factor-like helix-turn-helix DNA-binding protein, partial [Candidatus Eisenbacteria bacterium]|nr:sigma factor-like helix-turn-helix DNA-binding protein [Candidatus Eisenbacteria bacterium]